MNQLFSHERKSGVWGISVFLTSSKASVNLLVRRSTLGPSYHPDAAREPLAEAHAVLFGDIISQYNNHSVEHIGANPNELRGLARNGYARVADKGFVYDEQIQCDERKDGECRLVVGSECPFEGHAVVVGGCRRGTRSLVVGARALPFLKKMLQREHPWYAAFGGICGVRW